MYKHIYIYIKYSCAYVYIYVHDCVCIYVYIDINSLNDSISDGFPSPFLLPFQDPVATLATFGVTWRLVSWEFTINTYVQCMYIYIYV